jgi:hypothetical protein
VAFQLLALDARRGRLYLLAGGEARRLYLAEKLLREDRRLRSLLFGPEK